MRTRSPEVKAGLFLLALLGFLAAAAPWLGTEDPNLEFDRTQGRNLPPGSRRFELTLADGRRLLAQSATREADGVRVTRQGRTEFMTFDQLRQGSDQTWTRHRRFWLGTDRLGRDVWSRLVFGSRVSLIIAVLAALTATGVGITVGGIAALSGGRVDQSLMRITDAFLAFPRLFLLLALTSILRADLTAVVLILGATSWMAVSRLTRGEFLRLKGTDLALAPRVSGCKAWRVFVLHLLPNALAPIGVATVLRIADVLLLEAALSFLGMGVQPPNPSWGNMVADGVSDLSSAWWPSTVPGLAIVTAVLAFNLIGDGLQQSRPSTTVN